MENREGGERRERKMGERNCEINGVTREMLSISWSL